MLKLTEQNKPFKKVTEYQFLPTLQKKIILFLAEKKPQLKYRTVKALNEHQKSVWTAFDKLQAKNLITEFGYEESRNGNHPIFWLTTAGVFVALVEGADKKKLLNRTLEAYPENKTLQCLVELSTFLGTGMYKELYLSLLRNGKLEKIDFVRILGAEAGALSLNEISVEQKSKFLEMLTKYTEVSERIDNLLREEGKTLNDVEEAFQNGA